MRFLILLSLVLTQQASAHGGEHSMGASLYLTHLLGEHGLLIGFGVVVAAAVLWVLALRSDNQDN